MKFHNPSFTIQKFQVDRKVEKKQELRGGRYRTCIGQSQQTVKYSSRAPGQGACLKGMSRTITMQGIRLAAISDVKKTKL